jgi:hypothetical protein
LAVIDLLGALLRGVFMLAAGLLVLLVAATLLVFTFAFVLVAWVRGVLTGRRPTLQSSWAHVQRSAASAMWQRYQQRYRQGQGAQAAGSGPNATARPQDDVVDVDFREAPVRPAQPLDPNRRIETDRQP